MSAESSTGPLARRWAGHRDEPVWSRSQRTTSATISGPGLVVGLVAQVREHDPPDAGQAAQRLARGDRHDRVGVAVEDQGRDRRGRRSAARPVLLGRAPPRRAGWSSCSSRAGRRSTARRRSGSADSWSPVELVLDRIVGATRRQGPGERPLPARDRRVERRRGQHQQVGPRPAARARSRARSDRPASGRQRRPACPWRPRGRRRAAPRRRRGSPTSGRRRRAGRPTRRSRAGRRPRRRCRRRRTAVADVLVPPAVLGDAVDDEHRGPRRARRRPMADEQLGPAAVPPDGLGRGRQRVLRASDASRPRRSGGTRVRLSLRRTCGASGGDRRSRLRPPLRFYDQTIGVVGGDDGLLVIDTRSRTARARSCGRTSPSFPARALASSTPTTTTTTASATTSSATPRSGARPLPDPARGTADADAGGARARPARPGRRVARGRRHPPTGRSTGRAPRSTSAAGPSSCVTSAAATPTTTSWSRSRRPVSCSPATCSRTAPRPTSATAIRSTGRPRSRRSSRLGATTIAPGHGDVADRAFAERSLEEVRAIADLGRSVAAGELSLDEAIGRSPVQADRPSRRTPSRRAAGAGSRGELDE